MIKTTGYRTFADLREYAAFDTVDTRLDDGRQDGWWQWYEPLPVAAPGGGSLSAEDVVPGNNTTTAAVLVGDYVDGVIDTASDHDWYQVNLTAGQTYTFSTMFSLVMYDTLLQLRTSGGTVLASNDDANFESGYWLSEFTYTATSSGTFYLDVSGVEGDFGDFTLSVSRPVNDAIPASTASTTTLALDTNVNGVLSQTGDHDWYKVQLTAGQSYIFTTLQTGGAVDVDTALFLRDANGNLLAYNDDTSVDTYSRIRFTAPSTGTYYLDVGGWADSQQGDYRVRAEIAPPLQLFTNDQIAFQLTDGYWGGIPQYFNVSAGGSLTFSVGGLTADGQFLAREAMKLWSDATGITFNEVASGGQIQFDDTDPGAFTVSSISGGFIVESNVNISADWFVSGGTGLRSYSFQTFVHEVGHALGLGHAGPYNTVATFANDAIYLNDSWVTTVMSYFDQDENTYFNGLNFTRVYVQTPMVADILAMADLYGTATTTRTGNTTYGFNNTSGRAIYDAQVGLTSIAVTVVDHGGTDTLDYSGYSSNQRIDLNPETFSNIGGSIGNLTIARGTIIENAKGGNGADVLIGNSVGNLLDGGTGADQLYGGTGNDTYVTDVQGDLVFEDAAGGTDTVQSSGSFYLYANIENLMLTGSANIFGVGNELANTLTGNSGENLLIGWGGIDTINGGGARDSIFGVDGNDILNGEAGIDYMVAGNGEDIMNGGADADEMYGEGGNDTMDGGASFDTDIMVGGDGNDTLFGNSGLGDYDFLYGNLGNDIFYVDTPFDLVFEQPGEGTDTVYADINGAGFYLYDNIESLILLDDTPFGVGNGTANTLTGNAIGNYLLGGGGNDTINGKLGNDVLFGEAGNDTFVFESGTGSDVIGDFVRGQDKIDLSAFAGLTFSQVQTRFVQDGDVGAIQLASGDVIVLHNVTMSQLTASDFIFASSAEPVKSALGDLPPVESFQATDGMDQWLASYHAGAATF